MENNKAYPPGMIIFPNDQMKQFEEYMEKTKSMSQKQILAELIRAKTQVSKEMLDKHVKNLDVLSQTEGFLGEEHKERLQGIKRILLAENIVSRRGRTKGSDVESQYFWGIGSSWLWWLILASIWGNGYWGGYYGYPY